MMDNVIKIINQLQFVFQSTGSTEIQLPQIVVVGTQSCGKSSVLESFVGKSFLPRGNEIVTRCPIMLQLTHTKNSDDDNIEEFCIFSDEPDKRYTNFDLVREQIQTLTDINAGSSKGISPVPIILQVFSPHVVSLTVVDLPGIVKNAVEGQPEDIEDQVQALIQQYIENNNAIILAVSPANADIATSDSIKMAKQVDPFGDRTLGVITKLDLMDKGTDALKVLDGEIIKLKKGIIGVVNRSQQDIVKNTSIETAMQNERKFLEEKYPSKIGEIGSQFLAIQLNKLLIEHIGSTLPELTRRICDLDKSYRLKLKVLGPEIKAGEQELNWMIYDKVSEFIKDFEYQVKGRKKFKLEETEELPKRDLLGYKFSGAFRTLNDRIEKKCHQIHLLDHTILSKDLEETVNVERYTSIKDVFKSYARKFTKQMAEESITCADQVHDILRHAVGNALKDSRLKKLNEEISRVTIRLLKDQLDETKITIQKYIQIQSELVYSNDPRFLKILESLYSFPEEARKQEPLQQRPVENVVPKPVDNKISQQQISPAVSFPISSNITKSTSQTNYVKKLIQTYVEVTRYQICDYIPKHILHYLYESTIDKLKNEMSKAVAGKEKLLIQEDETTIRKRKEINHMLTSLKLALEVINNIECKF